MENPFEIINRRLSNIEALLLDIKHNRSEPLTRANSAPDIGDVKLAEEVTGLAKQTIYQMVSARRIPHRKQGRRLYFSRTELLAWIASGKRLTNEEVDAERDEFLTSKQKSL
jgi:excisionase family DNA binding protein